MSLLRLLLTRTPRRSYQSKARLRAIWPGCSFARLAVCKSKSKRPSLLLKAEPVKIAYTLTQRLVTMLKERNAQALDTWLFDCRNSGISDLVTFAQGLEKEGSAFHAALTLPYSNGPVEGKINKLKSIKRSMYGRSAFPLLRQKVLKAG